MKKSIRTSLIVASILILLVSASYVGMAAHHNTEMLIGKVNAYYANVRSGNFKEAFSNFKIGATVYLPTGFLKDLPSEEVRSMVIGIYESAFEQGMRLNLTPRHIQIKEYGDAAIATFYIEGEIIDENGDGESQLIRSSMVWHNDGDDWKIIHYHASELENEDD